MATPKGITVAVAMSGGVDSSVAAVLLQKQGYRVVGLTMQLWDYQHVGGNIYRETACCSLGSINDARAVCQKFGIPHYVVDLRRQFESIVIENFIGEYLKGRTPNPCIVCNIRIKWGSLRQKAHEIGADYFATGHYARVQFDSQINRYLLLKGCDSTKDQSYALWGLSQDDLSSTLFPVGELRKEQVREIARSLKLKTAERSESQEICFIPDDNYARFIRQRVPEVEKKIGAGEIVDTAGRVLGQHRGYPFYTIGQRRGLRVAVGKPVYVVEIIPEENRLVVAQKEELYRRGLIATQVNWIALEKLETPMRAFVKIRYKDPGFFAWLYPQSQIEVRIEFEKPQRAVTPGQSVVFYQQDVVLGGGVIESSF
ncbi:tRNA 2-thiouridine(34) synthase MnmA [candidate division KSB1 bacterium 4484_219]|nr:MAG: tRNA 2-thiouridine(34) synthase MnmA [candidate division KSB1 bacterium 4484_219]